MAKFQKIWTILVQGQTAESFARNALFYIALVHSGIHALITLKLQMADVDYSMHAIAALSSAAVAFYCLAHTERGGESFGGFWSVPAICILALTVWVVPFVYLGAFILNAMLKSSYKQFQHVAMA